MPRLQVRGPWWSVSQRSLNQITYGFVPGKVGTGNGLFIRRTHGWASERAGNPLFFFFFFFFYCIPSQCIFNNVCVCVCEWVLKYSTKIMGLYFPKAVTSKKKEKDLSLFLSFFLSFFLCACLCLCLCLCAGRASVCILLCISPLFSFSFSFFLVYPHQQRCQRPTREM